MGTAEFVFELVFSDPLYLSGRSVAQFLEIAGQVAEAPYVAICELEGAPTEISLPVDGTPSSTDTVVDMVASMLQIDWATFCLLKTPVCVIEPPPTIVGSSEAVVRCVDDQFIYFLTVHETLASSLSRLRRPDSVTKHEVTGLVWPR